MAQGELPGPARTRSLPRVTGAARIGRGGGDGHAVSHAEVGGVRSRRVASEVFVGKAQPFGDARHERRGGSELRQRDGRCGGRGRAGDHLHG